MFEFTEKDFKIFINLANPKKYYFYAEKELKGGKVIEVNGGMFKVFFNIEIKDASQKTIAKGGYKSLETLNVDLCSFINSNAL